MEREPLFTDILAQRLTEYKKGNYKLPQNDVFRLAKIMKLDTIYGIDHQLGPGDQIRC